MRQPVRLPWHAVSWGAAGLTAAAAAAALVPGHAGPVSREQQAGLDVRAQLDAAVSPAQPASPRTYTVRPGDTLGAISARFCGTPADYPSLARASGIRDADEIIPGEIVRLACRVAARVLSSSAPPRRVNADTAVVSASGVFGCRALEALWEQAGGPESEAFTAAEIAMAESGGRAGAVSPTDDVGLWQINRVHGSLATLSPAGNARAAVLISDDGRNWAPWTTFRTGAFRGRC